MKKRYQVRLWDEKDGVEYRQFTEVYEWSNDVDEDEKLNLLCSIYEMEFGYIVELEDGEEGLSEQVTYFESN